MNKPLKVAVACTAALLLLSGCASTTPPTAKTAGAVSTTDARSTPAPVDVLPACMFPAVDADSLPLLDTSRRLRTQAAPEDVKVTAKVKLISDSTVYDQQLNPIGVVPIAMPWEPSIPLVLPALDVPVPCAGATPVLLPAGTDAGSSAIGFVATTATTPAAGAARTLTIDTGAQTLTVTDDGTGAILLQTSVVTGGAGSPTPLGATAIVAKYTDCEAQPMTCPDGTPIPVILTGMLVQASVALADGQVGLHHGPASDAGSAGCVRLTAQAAAALATLVQPGDLVRVI